MTLKVPDEYEDFDFEERDKERERLAFAAQIGWCYDEFGDLIAGLSRRDGWQAPFRSMLRRLYNCPDHDPGHTIGRGRQKAIKPYLAILANLTPADLRPHAQRGSQIWHDGFLARWSFVFPDGTPTTETITEWNEDNPIPIALSKPLTEWHQRLGIPSVDVEALTDKKDKPTGKYRVRMALPLPEVGYHLSGQTKEAFKLYRETLKRIAGEGEEKDLDASYGRFAETALSIATLLASVEDHKNQRTVSIQHWQRGQQIAERWRESLCRMQINLIQGDSRSTTSKEQRIIKLLEGKGPLKARQIGRLLARHLSYQEVKCILEALVKLGVVALIPSGSTHVYQLEGGVFSQRVSTKLTMNKINHLRF